MTNRKTLIASTMGLALAFGAAALMGAAPQSGGNSAPPTTPPTNKHDGHDHKDGHKHDKSEKSARSKGAATVGQKAPDFQFKDLNGQSHSLGEFAGKTVVLEWINPGCPVCKGKFEKGDVTKMMQQAKAADPNVVFIFINSTEPGQGGSVESSAAYLKNNKVDALAFWEGEGTIGRLYDAKTTPHVFVIDKNGVLAYAGAIDDADSDKKGVNFVVEAVKALQAGKTPSPATTKPYGCSVKYPKKQKTTTG